MANGTGASFEGFTISATRTEITFDYRLRRPPQAHRGGPPALVSRESPLGRCGGSSPTAPPLLAG
jgi:hypothetical protein